MNLFPVFHSLFFLSWFYWFTNSMCGLFSFLFSSFLIDQDKLLSVAFEQTLVLVKILILRLYSVLLLFIVVYYTSSQFLVTPVGNNIFRIDVLNLNLDILCSLTCWLLTWWNSPQKNQVQLRLVLGWSLNWVNKLEVFI